MDDPKNLYATLGVGRLATQAEIKEAMRKLAKQYHPDREHGDAEKMAAVNAAYEVLSDPEKRMIYDQTGRVGEPETKEAKAFKIFVSVIQHVIKNEGNIIRNAKKELGKAIKDADKAIAQARKTLELNRARLDKITGQGTRPTLVHDIISSFVSQNEHAIQKANEELEAFHEAMNMFDDYLSTEVVSEQSAEANPFDELIENIMMGARR